MPARSSVSLRTSTISPCSKRSYIHAVAELGADDPAFHFVRDTCRSGGRLAVAAYRSLCRGRGLRRKALTRKRLLAEALGLLDRDGFEASTIRHLADHLGASPMAPYNHVSSKRDLLQGIAQHFLTQTSFSSGHSNWRDGSHRGSAARDLPPDGDHPCRFGQGRSEPGRHARIGRERRL